MKKLMLMLSGFMLLFLAGCEAAVTPTPRRNQDELDTVRIGANFELSGDAAQYGSAMLEGVQLAVKEKNEAGGVLGKEVEIISYDNKSDETETASVATKLSTEDGVSGVVGPATSGAANAQTPIVEQYSTPAILPAATNDQVTLARDGSVLEYIYRVCFQDSFQGVALAQFAHENGAKKAAIIKDNSSDYGQNLATAFRQTFEENGGEIVSEESYVAGDTDFNAILTNTASNDFDVIFIPGYYTEAGQIIKQARQTGIDEPILGPDGFGDAKLIELAGAQNVNDIYYSAHFSALTDDPYVQEFLANFEAEFGHEAGMFSALAYDAANLLMDSIEEAGTADPEPVREVVSQTTDYRGVTGTFSIDDYHNPIKDAFVIELQEGLEVDAVVVEAQAE